MINGKGDKPRPMVITKTEFDVKFDKIFKMKKKKIKKGKR